MVKETCCWKFNGPRWAWFHYPPFCNFFNFFLACCNVFAFRQTDICRATSLLTVWKHIQTHFLCEHQEVYFDTMNGRTAFSCCSLCGMQPLMCLHTSSEPARKVHMMCFITNVTKHSIYILTFILLLTKIIYFSIVTNVVFHIAI